MAHSRLVGSHTPLNGPQGVAEPRISSHSHLPGPPTRQNGTVRTVAAASCFRAKHMLVSSPSNQERAAYCRPNLSFSCLIHPPPATRLFGLGSAPIARLNPIMAMQCRIQGSLAWCSSPALPVADGGSPCPEKSSPLQARLAQ